MVKIQWEWLPKILLLLFPIFGVIYYFQTDIANKGSFIPTCLIKKFTGFSCVACGTQRALYELLHGNLLKAMQYNALFVMVLPILIYFYLQITSELFFSQYHLKNKWLRSNSFWKLFFAIGLGFMILRNIPGFTSYLSV